MKARTKEFIVVFPLSFNANRLNIIETWSHVAKNEQI